MNSVQCSRSPRPCGAAFAGALGLVSAALVGAGLGCKIEARLPLADAAGSAELGPDARRARDLSRDRTCDRPVPWEAGAARPPWVLSPGGNDATPQAIAVDSQGNIVLSVLFGMPVNGVTTFGATTLVSVGYDAALVKLDASGNVLWAKNVVSSTGEDSLPGLALDSAGQIHVAGSKGGSAFVAKLDPAGNVLWTAAPSTSSAASAIALDSAGNSFVAGAGPFVVKLDAQGKTLWTATSSSTSSSFADAVIALDGSGNALISGGSSGTSFGTHPVACGTYVAKVSAAGAWLWATSVSYPGCGPLATPLGYGQGIVAESAGSASLAGIFGSATSFGSIALSPLSDRDLFVAKLDADGTFVWALSGGGNVLNNAAGLARDSAGHLTLAGTYSGHGSLGAFSLPKTTGGGDALLVAKLDGSGQMLWVVTAQGATGDAVAVDLAGAPHVAGTFASATFGAKSLTQTKGKRSIYVARMTPWGTFD